MNKLINWKTLGADVEMFLQNKKTGEVVSAEGYVKGTKYDPFCFDPINKWYTTSLDNVLLELTIPPVKTANEFVAALKHAMKYGKSTLPKDLDLLITPSAVLDEKYLMTEQALVFGCEPDFNAYTMSINEKPYCENEKMRSAGGHIHLGFDNIEVPFDGNIYNYDIEMDTQRARVVQMLDLHLSIPAVIMEPDNDRKLLYGKGGAYRPKDYGVEYRTISNFYLSSTKLMRWAFNSVRAAVEQMNTKGFLETHIADFVRETIDNNDKVNAKELIKEFNLQLV